jgi:hypothetical protein
MAGSAANPTNSSGAISNNAAQTVRIMLISIPLNQPGASAGEGRE